MPTDYLNHYVIFYQSLAKQEIPNLDYFSNQNNLKIFIDYFPEFNWDLEKNFQKQLQKYIPLAVEYIKTFQFLSPDLSKIFSLITSEKILHLGEIAEKHREELLKIISTPQNEREKKRFYLGILWFLIGYYICYVIAKINYNHQFPSMIEAADNKWALFLTSCFIFYDDIFDLEELPILAKKECLGFTQYFFEYVLEILSTEKYSSWESISQIRDKYARFKNIEFQHIEIMQKVEKVLDVCWQEILRNIKVEETSSNLTKLQLVEMIKSIQDLFLTEIRVSKLQKQNLEIEDKLKLMLEKSQKSILVIWKGLLPHSHINAEILDLTYRFSFLSQLLDDLNDRELDIQDGNHTIFTINNCVPEIKKTLLYILNVKQYFDKIQLTNANISKIFTVSNHLANMFVFNYAFGKQNSMENTISTSISNCLFLQSQDILKIRSKKIKYQKIFGYLSFK